MTRDIDMVIDPTPESIGRFVAALDRARYYVDDAVGAVRRRGDLEMADEVVVDALAGEPQHLPVDIVTQGSHLTPGATVQDLPPEAPAFGEFFVHDIQPRSSFAASWSAGIGNRPEQSGHDPISGLVRAAAIGFLSG